jgi:thiol:disulfide interchange protein DsbD
MKNLISLMFLVFAFSSCQHSPSNPSKFHWKPYSKDAVADSVAHHKPIVIDFFAEWCPNCHDLDREVYSLPQIQAKLAKYTTLRVDATNQDDPKVQQNLQDYGIEGLPTVIFLDAKGQEIKDSRVIGFVTPEEFEQALAMVSVLK